MSCKENNLTFKEKKDEADSTEEVTVMQQENIIQETDPVVQKDNDVCALLEEELQTEGSDCLDMFGPLLEALERENRGLFSQKEQLQMSCKEINLTFKDVSEKDKAERAEDVTVMQQEGQKQEPESLLQKQNDVCGQKELKISEEDNILQQETRNMEEELQTEGSDCLDALGSILEALERENRILTGQIEQLQISCKYNNLIFKDVSERDEAERAEEVTVMQQDQIQEPDSLLQKHNDVCGQEELKTSEEDNILQQETSNLEEEFKTEGSDCLDALRPILEALERENRVLTGQIEQLQISCKDNNLTFKDVSEKDEAERAEEVTVIQQEDQIQEPDPLLQKHNDVCGQEELKISEEDNILQQEMSNLEVKLKTEGSDCLDTLGPKLERENKALSNEVKQLKISFERMAEKYMAETRKKEAIQNIIQELNIKLQNEMDFCIQQQLKASEGETVLHQEIDDLRETLHKERDEDSKLQAWEKEKKAYLQEIEDIKLCYEGKTLRFNDMFDKLKAEKAHKEAIKEEQFKKIQALNIKVRQQQDFCIQQKLRASERENMLSLKLKELEEKISCYEKGARPKLTVRSNTEHEDIIDEDPKPKKRKGWKKVAYNIKPWHWRKK